MLKTNVINRTYQIIRCNASGNTRIDIVTAESPFAARVKAGDLPGWEIAEVTEL